LLATTGLLGGAAAVAAADQSAPVTEYHVPTTDADPYGVASAPNGSTWFTEWAADKIGELTPAGSFNEYAVPTAAAEPDHIAIGPAGSVVCRDCLAGLLAGRPKDSLS
jgi:streptogramin lyase